MQNAVQKIAGGIGAGFSTGIGMAIAKIAIIFIFIFLALAVLGILFLGLAVFFYKKQKPKSFLVFGILSSFSLSLIISIIISSKLAGNFSLMAVSVPIFLFFGFWIVYKKYKELL